MDSRFGQRPPGPTRTWGKAGKQISREEAAGRALARRNKAAAAREREQSDHERYLDEAYRLWRAGEFRPYQATFLLNLRGLYGPEVDEACGAEEPAVDEWEDGIRYPTWDQLLALADLCDTPPRAFVAAADPLRPQDTSMRFHFPPESLDDSPSVLRCLLPAIRAVVAGTPERRPR
jgi:hypothetical protein